MYFTKNVLLNWYFLIKKIRQIWTFFDVENWFWMSKFHDFWHLCAILQCLIFFCWNEACIKYGTHQRHNPNLGIGIHHLKVSKSRKQFMVSSILPKNKRKTLFWLLSKEDAQDIEFSSIFGRIEDITNCFRDLLTFKSAEMHVRKDWIRCFI